MEELHQEMPESVHTSMQLLIAQHLRKHRPRGACWCRLYAQTELLNCLQLRQMHHSAESGTTNCDVALELCQKTSDLAAANRRWLPLPGVEHLTKLIPNNARHSA